MRLPTMRDQAIDTGGRLVVRRVRDVVLDQRGVASGVITLRNQKRAVRRTPGATFWTLVASERRFTWDDFEAGDAPETDDEMYDLIDGLDVEEVR